MDKKGQMFDQMAGLAIGTLTVAVILVVALLVLAEGKDQAIDKAASISFTNSTESITINQTTALEGSCVNERSLSVTEVFNGTQGNGTRDDTNGFDALVLLSAGNYTITNNGINISDGFLGAGVGSLVTSVNISFTCVSKSKAYNATVTMQNATSDIPAWVPLIILAAIGAMLLGIVQLFRNRG